MDIDECITAYSELTRTIFDVKSSWLPFNLKLQVGSRFDSTKLESAIKSIITTYSASESDLFNDKVERRCKV